MNCWLRNIVGTIGIGGSLCTLGLAQDTAPELKSRPFSVTNENIEKFLDDPDITSVTLRGGRFYGSDRISDEGVKVLVKLKNLKKLGLLGMEVSDESLKLVGKMTTLEELDLSGCKITDDGLKHLKGLVNLKILRANLSGAGLVHLGHLSKMEEVDFGYSFKITLEHIKYLSKLPNLRRLRFPNQIPTDETMAELSVLKHLESLEIGHCSDYVSMRRGLSEKGFAHLASFRKLTRLKLGSAHGITSSSIKVISKLKYLRSLSLVESGVKASDFEPLGELEELETFLLWGWIDNKNGELNFLSRLKKLKSFRSNINFNDHELKSLCEARSLTKLVIQSKQLSDDAQAKLSQLSLLRKLNLQGKGFGQSSFKALRQLNELRSLGLHKIALQGMTTDLGKLKQLESLQLGYEKNHQLTKAEIDQLKSDLPDCKVK